MADPSVVSRIVQYMQTKKNQPCKTYEILQFFRGNKKQLNTVLYHMQKRGVIKKVQMSPPMWQLQGDGSAGFRRNQHIGPNPQTPYGRGRAPKPKHGFKTPRRKTSRQNKIFGPDTANAVLRFLQSQQRPSKAVDIAHAVGFTTSSEVNPVLYRMKKNGQITIASDHPVLWISQGTMFPRPNSSNMEKSFNQEGVSNSEMFTDISDVQLNFEEQCMENEIKCDRLTSLGEASDQIAGSSYQENRSSLSYQDNVECFQMEEHDEQEGMENIDSIENNDTSVSSENSSRNVSHLLSDDSVVVPENQLVRGTPPSGAVFTDLDKLLQTLLTCPMSMARIFVLASKMKMSDNKISEIVQEGKKFKYVNEQNSVIVLDQKGEDYIRKKLVASGNEEKVQIGLSKPNLMPLQPRVQSTGKPLSPFELLSRERTPPVSSFNPRLSGPASFGMLSSRLPLNCNTNGGLIPRAPQSFPVRCLIHDNSKPVQSGVAQPLTGIQSNSVISRLMKISQSDASQFQSLPSSQTKAFDVTSSHQSNSVLPGPSLPGSYKSPGESSQFKPPQAPVDIVREQLKQTEISQGIPVSAEKSRLESIGMQRLLNFQHPSGSSTPSLLKVQSDNYRQQPQSLPVAGRLSPATMSSEPTSLNLDFSSESFAALNKNPVSALMEYAQSRHKVARIEVIRQSGPSHRPKFVMGVFIGNEQLATVTCANKKDGRKEAADMALRALIAAGKYNTEKTPTKNVVPASQMTHFDRVAALTHQQFNSLVASIADNFAGRKVIAGLVMKTSEADIGTVIAIGTGNRCITGQQLSLEGNTVNDSHAEIITRRGFIRFLYKKLLTFEPNSPNGFFVKSESGKLKIRDGITFHLYISTAPCGDGALFSPRDAASNNVPLATLNDRSHHPTFTSQVQGLLRTKMEGGEGTIPVEPDFTAQTFDGIQRGERLRTMSCTDKICRWNVVGMQGALLSHFLDPIYLDSLTLGFLFDPGHLARAVCCRVNRGDTDVNDMLPSGYHLNHPWLGRVTAVEPSRETQKTKALSINWCYGDDRPEVTDGTQGLCYTSIEKAFFSRCTKKNLYDSFKQVCQKFGRQDLLQLKTYNQAKMAAKEFQEARKAMLKKMTENSYGTWVSKPVEEEMFG